MSEKLEPSLSKEQFESILEVGEAMAYRAGTELEGPRFSAEPSALPLTTKPVKSNTCILTVDVGGTHTKVGLREADSKGRIRWIGLLDVYNDDLNTGESSEPKLARMVHALDARIERRLNERSIPQDAVRGVGVVWSNKVRSRLLDPGADAISGVTGTVLGVDDGVSYRKGEWFTSELEDGDDLGELLYSAFRDTFPIEAFVISNDTVFTFKAIDGADAGIVASTGANGTIIPHRDHSPPGLCNAESGGTFTIPDELLAPADRLDDGPVKLEDLVAGMGLGPRFTRYAKSLAHHDEALAPCLDEGEFDNVTMSHLLNRKYDELFNRYRSWRAWGSETLGGLTSLAEKFMGRAGMLAAALVYFSICNQLEEKDEVRHQPRQLAGPVQPALPQCAREQPRRGAGTKVEARPGPADRADRQDLGSADGGGAGGERLPAVGLKAPHNLSGAMEMTASTRSGRARPPSAPMSRHSSAIIAQRPRYSLQ